MDIKRIWTMVLAFVVVATWIGISAGQPSDRGGQVSVQPGQPAAQPGSQREVESGGQVIPQPEPPLSSRMSPEFNPEPGTPPANPMSPQPVTRPWATLIGPGATIGTWVSAQSEGMMEAMVQPGRQMGQQAEALSGATPAPQEGSQPGGQPGRPMGQQPGPQPGAIPGTVERTVIQTIIGTVKNVDPSGNTLTVELSRDFAGRQKGEEMTFKIGTQAKWEGSPWKTLSDIKPGEQVEFVQYNVTYEVQALRVPTGAAGEEQGRGAGQPDQPQAQPSQPQYQTGQPQQMQPGQQAQLGAQPGAGTGEQAFTFTGTVTRVDPSNKTVTIEMGDISGGQRQEEMTFGLADQVRWGGSWNSLSDLKPGQRVGFNVIFSEGKHQIQAIYPGD